MPLPELPNPTIAALIEQSCRHKPYGVLVSNLEQELTGFELWSRIQTVGVGLQDLGVQKGDIAVFLCGSSVNHTIDFFSCLQIGVIPCCLHTQETRKRNRDNLAFLQPKLLFADPDNFAEAQGLLNEVDDIVLIQLGTLATECSESSLLSKVHPDDPALLLLSSGTTGRPKCILHSQRTLAATANYGPHSYGCWSSNDSTVVFMQPSFAAWIHTVLPFIAIGGRVVFGGKFSPEVFLQTLESEKITLAPLVPTLWRMVLAANPAAYDLSNVKTAFFSGESGSESLVQSLQERICPNVMTSYLASEGGCASAVVADATILSITEQAASTGLPVPDAEVRIIDPDGSISVELPQGEVGEIVLKSASLAVEYWGDSEQTKQRFPEGWWCSGDLGFLDENGLLFVKGRLDNRINTGGVKVHAEEVEAALMQHPKVQLAAVVGVDDSTWGQRIEAHLVVKTKPVVAQEVLDYCLENDLISKPFLPKAVHFHENLPTGPTGKLYRRGLRGTASSTKNQ